MRRWMKRHARGIANRLVLNFAAMVFLGVTGFLTWRYDTWSDLFSWQGLLFLLCGLIVSGHLIGALLTYGHQKLIRWMAERADRSFADWAPAIIHHSGTLVLLCQLLSVYYLTQWAFAYWVVY